MIDGQENVTWPDWVEIAQTCERLGFEALLASDHYSSVYSDDDRGGFDAWATLGALAARTSTLRLGTLLSPVTFRSPSVLAKNVVTVDHISGGRVELGLGAGWMDAEHAAHGIPFPPVRERMEQLGEQLAIIRGAWGRERFTFEGAHFAVRDLDARPKPVQDPLPLLMGGGCGQASARMAARWADEYNVHHMSPADAAIARTRLDSACELAGRDPATLPLSLLRVFVIGEDETAICRRAQRLSEWQNKPVDLADMRQNGLAGTPDEIIARLREYRAAGVARVMFNHLLHTDVQALELLAARVMPALVE